MRLYRSNHIKKIESDTMSIHGTSSLELMDRASNVFVDWIIPKINKTDKISVLCGKYNNGADGLVIGEKLLMRGYNVSIWVLDITSSQSAEFEFHYNRILPIFPDDIVKVQTFDEISLGDNPIIIDAIFGNGLNRPLSGEFLNIIRMINRLNCTVFAVDVPSGMNSDEAHGWESLQCDEVLCFEYPKLALFQYGKEAPFQSWNYGSIDLDDSQYRTEVPADHLITKEMLSGWLKSRPPHSHKGLLGHALIVAGSPGMGGAAMLAGKACIRSGCGLVTLITGRDIFQAVHSSSPEIMCLEPHDEKIESILNQHNSYLGIGPGLSTSNESKQLLNKLLQGFDRPVVLDADGLNLLSQNPEMWTHLPENSVLTPHPKEFDRLFGPCLNRAERIKLQKAKSVEMKVNIVLKGRYTCITDTRGNTYYNASGNPGMATAGSGDVLLGIITGLIAQGYQPHHAAIMGTYIHGITGDLTSISLGQNSMTAHDIIDFLPLGFQHLS